MNREDYVSTRSRKTLRVVKRSTALDFNWYSLAETVWSLQSSPRMCRPPVRLPAVACLIDLWLLALPHEHDLYPSCVPILHHPRPSRLDDIHRLFLSAERPDRLHASLFDEESLCRAVVLRNLPSLRRVDRCRKPV